MEEHRRAGGFPGIEAAAPKSSDVHPDCRLTLEKGSENGQDRIVIRTTDLLESIHETCCSLPVCLTILSATTRLTTMVTAEVLFLLKAWLILWLPVCCLSQGADEVYRASLVWPCFTHQRRASPISTIAMVTVTHQLLFPPHPA